MKKSLALIGLLGLWVLGANAAETADVPVQTCEQIREQIKTVTGLDPKGNTELLQSLSLRTECQFSSAEVYRAAYGDKPLPKPDVHQHPARHDDDED